MAIRRSAGNGILVTLLFSSLQRRSIFRRQSRPKKGAVAKSVRQDPKEPQNTRGAKLGNIGPLVSGRLFDVINDEDFNPAFGRFKFES
jgi:hypothetical protein